MFHPSIRPLRALALAAVLGGAMAAAQAGGVSVGVNVGVPLVGAYGTPVGSVGLQVGSGRGWGRHGGHRHGGWGLGLGLMQGRILQTDVVCLGGTPADNTCMQDLLGQANKEADVPPVFPVINAIIGLQIRPIKSLALNVEGGLRTTPYVGISTTVLF